MKTNSKRSVFLNRNLSFNQYTNIKLNEYYLHALSKTISAKSMIRYIKDFQQKRLNNVQEKNSELIIFNNSNFKETSLEINSDYYTDCCLSCLICKSSFNNLGALMLHYKLYHVEYNIFHYKKVNSLTDLKEIHIMLFLQFKASIITIDPLKSKIKIFGNKTSKNTIALTYLSYMDILKMNPSFSSDEPLEFEKNYHNEGIKSKLKKNLTNKKRIFYHSITGEVFDPTNEIERKLEKQIDDSYIKIKENKVIDEYFDVCEKDKHFFKLWNSFINENNKHISKVHIEKIIMNFIQKSAHQIKELDLKENLFLHIISLYDYSLLDRNQIISICKELESKIDN